MSKVPHHQPSLCRSITTFAVGGALLGLTAACTPTGAAVGAAASTGIAAAQERTLTDAGRDLWIQAQINELWFSKNADIFQSLGLTVNEGRVLVTGDVETQDQRVEAIRAIWQVEGVNEVINEVTVGEDGGIQESARDALILAEVRSNLLLDREVKDVNYTIDVVAGTIHIMGLAASETERQRVISHAKSINRVKRVVDHTWLIGDTRRVERKS